MSREDAIKVEGTVVEALPNTVFLVELANRHRVLAHVAGRWRKSGLHFLPGMKVLVEMSPYDLSRGCIVMEEKN